MKCEDEKLREALAKLAVPPGREGSREDALRLAREARGASRAEAEPISYDWWKIGGSLAAAACLLTIAIGHWPAGPAEPSKPGGQLLAEVEMLFPGRSAR